ARVAFIPPARRPLDRRDIGARKPSPPVPDLDRNDPDAGLYSVSDKKQERKAMVAVQDKARRIRESHAKICKPFELDESLCLYCPQDNVDALAHARVRDWLEFITTSYEPEVEPDQTRVLLLMPCTKTKPYVFSTEHKRINQALHNAGYRPTK